LRVAAAVGSAPTKKKRNWGAAASRRSVAPLPSIVMSLAIGGSAFSPYQPLAEWEAVKV
jgi:hypothetical protein